MNKPYTEIRENLRWSVNGLAILILCLVISEALFSVDCLARELPEWTDSIRNDHPRLFFNSDT